MPKKSTGTGLFALITGAVAGAAAVFFSDEKNRKMVKKEFTMVEKGAVKASKEIQKNPTKFVKKVEKKVVKAEKKLQKQVVKKVSNSPALKAVGKKIAKKK